MNTMQEKHIKLSNLQFKLAIHPLKHKKNVTTTFNLKWLKQAPSCAVYKVTVINKRNN